MKLFASSRNDFSLWARAARKSLLISRCSTCKRLLSIAWILFCSNIFLYRFLLLFRVPYYESLRSLRKETKRMESRCGRRRKNLYMQYRRTIDWFRAVSSFCVWIHFNGILCIRLASEIWMPSRAGGELCEVIDWIESRLAALTASTWRCDVSYCWWLMVKLDRWRWR